MDSNDSFRAGRRAPIGSARREKDALRPPPGRGRRRVGARDFVLLILRGDQRHRQVHPRRWTRHNTSTTHIIRRMCIRSSLDFIRVISIRRGMSITRGMMLSFTRGISLSSLLNPSMSMLLSSIMLSLLSSSILSSSMQRLL